MSWMNEWTNECVSSVKAIRMICGLLFRTWLDSHKYSGPTQWCTPEEGTCWNFILFESHTKCSKQWYLKKKKSVTCNVSWVQWKCFTVGFPGYSLYVSKQADRMIGGSSGKKTMNSSYFHWAGFETLYNNYERGSLKVSGALVKKQISKKTWHIRSS